MRKILALLLCCCATVSPVRPTDTVRLSSDAANITLPEGCTGVVRITDEISDPAAFVAAMAACNDRAVVVEINSPGGSVFGALEMQKAIEAHPHPVLCMVDGMAASAAFVTLQACDVRTMTPRSILMAHEASLRAGGQLTQVVNAEALLRALNKAMALFVTGRMGMDLATYEAKVSNGKEWWIPADEARAVNAIDFEVSGLSEALMLTSFAQPDAGS